MTRAFRRPVGRNNGQGQLIEEFFIEESFRGIYSGNNLTYAGFAKPGSSESEPLWQIEQITYDINNNIISIKWPLNSSGICSNDYEFQWSVIVANPLTYTWQ